MATDRELIVNWRLAKLRLAQAKRDELSWRNLIAKQLFPHAELGTNWYGDEAKLVAKENFTLDRNEELVAETLAEVFAKYTDEQRTISCVVEYRPSFKEPAYRLLSDAAKQAFASVLTIKPGLPTVSLKGEKE